MSALAFSNRQRARSLNTRLLREITLALLDGLPGVEDWELAFFFVGAQRMSEINEGHLGHRGVTDVITFGYNDPDTPWQIAGDVFICVDVAVAQAREYRTTWQSEVIRYIVHALLHLCGHDDLSPSPRRRMKLAENRLVRKLRRQFDFGKLGR
jgi:probable rRNA maturation factor